MHPIARTALALMFLLVLNTAHANSKELEYEMTIHIDYEDFTLRLVDHRASGEVFGTKVVLPTFMPHLPATGYVTVVERTAWWYPTDNIRREYKEKYGEKLAKRISPNDPQNALEGRKIKVHYFSPHASDLWRIHGEDEPGKIGKRLSHGCIRLLNSAWDALADRIAGKRTKVVLHR